MSTNLALALTMPEGFSTSESHGMASDCELETLDEAIAEINLQLAGAYLHSVELRDRRENLLEGRAELRRRRRRVALFEERALINFYSIDYADTVANYFDPDPNLMRGDGWRQVWPPGALEKIRLAEVVKVRR